ncbi:5767_t:CDS:1, partial [Paraglomus brasilianum]
MALININSRRLSSVQALRLVDTGFRCLKERGWDNRNNCIASLPSQRKNHPCAIEIFQWNQFDTALHPSISNL